MSYFLFCGNLCGGQGSKKDELICETINPIIAEKIDDRIDSAGRLDKNFIGEEPDNYLEIKLPKDDLHIDRCQNLHSSQKENINVQAQGLMDSQFSFQKKQQGQEEGEGDTKPQIFEKISNEEKFNNAEQDIIIYEKDFEKISHKKFKRNKQPANKDIFVIIKNEEFVLLPDKYEQENLI